MEPPEKREATPARIRHHKPRQLDDLVPLVVDSVASKNTQRAYQRAIEDFLAWVKNDPTRPSFDRALVQRYMRHLGQQQKAPSTINQSLTVLRRFAFEAADHNLIDPHIARTLERIKPIKRLGKHTGQWLDQSDARRLITSPKLETNKGLRDRVLLGLLLECGLRRDEASMINAHQFQVREGRHVLIDVKGKGQRIRTVPVPNGCAIRIKQWIKTARISEGPLLRPVDKADHIAPRSLTAPAIYKQVCEYARELKLEFAPHDLRRTFAKLAYKRDPGLIGQIKEALGHASIRTTEIYLGIRLNLKDAACDVLDLDDTTEEKK